MTPPPPLPAGTAIRAPWIRQLCDYVRSITLRSGVGYRLSRTSGGTTLVLSPRTGESDRAFDGVAFAENGAMTTGLNSDPDKRWVEYDEETYAFREVEMAPSSPWPARKRYRRKSDLRGAWYTR